MEQNLIQAVTDMVAQAGDTKNQKVWAETLINKVAVLVPDKQLKWVANNVSEAQTKIETMTGHFFKKKDELLKKTEKNILKFKQLIKECEEEENSEPDFLDVQTNDSNMAQGFKAELVKQEATLERLSKVDGELPNEYAQLLKFAFERINGKESEKPNSAELQELKNQNQSLQDQLNMVQQENDKFKSETQVEVNSLKTQIEGEKEKVLQLEEKLQLQTMKIQAQERDIRQQCDAKIKEVIQTYSNEIDKIKSGLKKSDSKSKDMDSLVKTQATPTKPNITAPEQKIYRQPSMSKEWPLSQPVLFPKKYLIRTTEPADPSHKNGQINFEYPSGQQLDQWLKEGQDLDNLEIVGFEKVDGYNLFNFILSNQHKSTQKTHREMKTFMTNLNGVKIAKVQVFSVYDMGQNFDMVGLKLFKKNEHADSFTDSASVKSGKLSTKGSVHSNSNKSHQSDGKFSCIFEIGYTRCAFKETVLHESERIIGVRARVIDNWPAKYFDFEIVLASKIQK